MKAGIYETQFLEEKVPFVYCVERKEAEKIIKHMFLKYPKDYVMGFDTETAPTEEYLKYPKAGLSPHLNRVRLLQIYTGKGVVVFDMFKINDISIFKKFLERYHFVAHYAVFDLKQFYKLNITQINVSCTMLMFTLLIHARQPTDAGVMYGLAPIMKGVFNIDVSKANQAHNWELEELTYEQVEYSALDAIYVRKLYKVLYPLIVKRKLLKYHNLCKDLQHAVAEIEVNGIRLVRNKHIKHVDKWRQDLYEAKQDIARITGLKKITNHTIAAYLEANLDKDYLDIWPRTDTGILKTDSQVFADFEHLDIVGPFSKFKEISKMTTSFGMNLLQYINPETKRIHPSYKICGARTGRMSCSKPNFQQMPRDPLIRESFRPAKGQVFVSCDYSMIELRVIAELGKDKNMLKAFREGQDLHEVTASAVSHVPLDKVTKTQRQVAKCCNYGLIFGLGYNGLILQAKKLFGIDMSMEEAKNIKDSFGDMYFGVATWQVNEVDKATKHKTSITPYGKIRKLDPKNCYGAAMNSPVQGGAAECIFLSLLALRRLREKSDVPFKIVSCVHDEIMLECDKNTSKQAAKLLEEAMVEGYLTVFPKGVTTGLVEAKIGKSWKDVH